MRAKADGGAKLDKKKEKKLLCKNWTEKNLDVKAELRYNLGVNGIICPYIYVLYSNRK